MIGNPINHDAIRKWMLVTMLGTSKDTSWVGSVLIVIHVELPFVIIKEIASKYGVVTRIEEGKPYSIDINRKRFQHISREYAIAMGVDPVEIPESAILNGVRELQV